jgi:zinc protease
LHPSLKELVLPSGLRLLLDEDPGATTAGVVSVVAGGSSADPPGRDGLAHLVEHLTFRAVDTAADASERGATRGDRLIRYAVAEMNGYTTRDALIFYEFAPAQRLPSLIALEAQRLTAPLMGVDEDALAIERQVVGSEHLVRDDPRAGGWAAHALVPRLFPPQHPYARSPAGTDESRRKATLADARAFAEAAFRPERTTLLVAAPPGATSLEVIAEGLPAALRGDAAHPVTRPPRVKVPGADAALADGVVAAVERKTSPLPTAELWIGWRLPAAVGAARATEEVLQRWLQGDVGSDSLLEEEPKIRHVRVVLDPGASASVLLVRVLTAEGADPERIARVVVARVSSAWSREPTERDAFDDLKRFYETEQLFDDPPQVPRALMQALFAATSERATSMTDVWSQFRAVTSAAVAKLAYEHLTREKARAVMFTPAPAPADGAHAGVTAPLGAGSVREVVPGAAGWNPAELLPLSPPPAHVVTKKLENGLTVVTIRRRGPTASAWLAFRGGTSDAEPPLIAELAMRVRADARQATRLHMLPARGATRDLSYDVVRFLPSQLPEALTLLFAKATVAVQSWPTNEGLSRMLAPMAAEEDAQVARGEGAFWRALFGDHPYARIVSAGDLGKLTRSDVDAWLGRVHTSRNAALVVMGDVAPADVEHAAGILSTQIKAPAWLADLAAPPAVVPRPAGPAHVVPVITARRGALTDVRLACVLPSLTRADAGHFELLEHAVEARLNAALRSEHGETYGVSVDVQRLRGGTTYLVASTFVGDENLTRSLAALHREWQRWSQSGFDASEINVARWRLAGAQSFRFASGDALVGRFLGDWNVEPSALIEGEIQQPLFADVGTLRGARVNELFATCKSNAVLGLTGGEALVRRALEQSWPGLAPR